VYKYFTKPGEEEMKIPIISIGLVLTFLWSGYSFADRTTAEYPSISPLGKTIEDYKPYSEKPFGEAESPQLIQSLTLDRALRLALMHNPDLAAYSLEVRALEASTLQAGLSPNPEIEFAGTGEIGAFSSAETTLMLSQEILLGDKIKKRTLAAVLESDLAAWDYEIQRLDIITNVKEAFIKVLSAQEEIELKEKLLKLSTDFLTNINRLIKAGKVNPAEASRARVIVSTIQLDIKSAKLALLSAKSQLASLWGSEYPNFHNVEGKLDIIQSIPPLDRLRTLLDQNPALARYKKELEQKQAVVDLEKANAIPDMSIGAGYRRMNDTDDNALVATFSMPLPIRDRNQGSIAEARLHYNKTKREHAALKIRLNSELSLVYNSLINLHQEIVTIKNEILPDAEKAFRMIEDGSTLGRFTVLDVLDVERTLFEVQSQYIRAITEFGIAKVEIEHLIAQKIESIENGKQEEINNDIK
jgi:cobalt-zinc-cadmium efflux system outer membrane protein